MLAVRFWGVRGSIPCPGRETVIYGGNTSCIEIRANDRLIIVDMGTGARRLGGRIEADDFKKYGKIKADIFVTHTHWDHIMGFPMFTPVYNNKTELRVTGPVVSENESLKQLFEAQFSHNYWPVIYEELAAEIEYNQIKETELDLGDGLTVTSKILNHPTTCLGYRFSYMGKSVAVVYDHEPFSDSEENEKIVQFLQGTDLLIHDAQYTQDGYKNHVGWGHSSMEHAIKTAEQAAVKKLILFHHDPAHTDNQLEMLEKKFANNQIPTIMAKEDMVIIV
jgi:phosphoribosyl 1,2-cyclic phosphodiesterase